MPNTHYTDSGLRQDGSKYIGVHRMSDTKTIAEMIAGHTYSTPDATAIATIDGMTLTWKQLASVIAAAAEDWRKFGIAPTDTVATSMSTVVPATPVAFLTVAAASGCLPLNSDYRVRECTDHMKGGRARAFVVFGTEESEAVEAARSLGLLIIRVSPGAMMSGRWVAQIEGSATSSAFHRPPEADDVALVLQTSGTTAQPKIVPLTQENLVTSARQIAATLKLTPGDGCLNLMPLFHIHGLMASTMATLRSALSRRDLKDICILSINSRTDHDILTASASMAVSSRSNCRRIAITSFLAF